MDNLFLLLFLASFLCLIIGLVKPTVFSRFAKGKIKRKKIGLIFGIAIIAFFVIFGMIIDTNKQTQSNTNEKAAEQKTEPKQLSPEEQAKKAEEDSKKKAEEEQKELKTSTMKGELPKINFSGEILPSLATKGEKVVVKIDIENLSDKVTIDDVRLLFSDKSFISEGLTVVNIMSGGQQDTDRSFTWKGVSLMEVPPKEKRSFQIITQAKNLGSYKSIISIKSNSKVFSDPEGNEELTAKLVVFQ